MFLAPMAVGAVTSILGAAGTFAAAAAPLISSAAPLISAGMAMKSAKQESKLPIMQQAPQQPSFYESQVAEKNNLLRAAQKRTKTILTSPMGVTNESPVNQKRLVGKLGEA